MGKPKVKVHLLSGVDPEARTGKCAECGPVKLKRRNPRVPSAPVRWSCMNAEKQYRPWRPPPEKRDRAGEWARKKDVAQRRYEELLAAQGGKCAICHAEPSPDDKRFALDHDHECCPYGRTACGSCARGILCRLCNLGLGYFRDNPDLMLAAIAYLESYRR